MTTSRQDENFGQQKANIKAQYSIILHTLPMLSLLATCLLLPQLFAENSPSIPGLTGIFNLPGHKAAWLEIVSGKFHDARWKLREGERCVDVEVSRIQPESGEVELRLAWTNAPVIVSLPRQGNNVQTKDGSIEFVDTNIEPVLGLYAECKGRTSLRWEGLKVVPVAQDLARIVPSSDPGSGRDK